MANSSARGSTAGSGDRRPAEEWDGVKSDAQRIADTASAEARKLSDTAKREATTFADRRKNSVAQSVSDIADSIRETGEGFGDKPNIHAFTKAAADGLEDLSEQISQKSFGELYTDAERFARARPMVVAAGAAAIGLLAARFLKSSAEKARASEREYLTDDEDDRFERGGRYS